MIDLNSGFFTSRVLIVVSAQNDEPQIKNRKNQNFAKLL